MSPQAPTATPAQPVVPMANQVNPQGVSTPPVTTAPTPSALPTAPQITPLSTTPAPQQTNLLPSQLENIANYYSIPRQTAAMVNAAQAQGANAQQATKYSTAQSGYTADMAQKQLDPSSYNITQDSSSPLGIKIINPLGQEVSLSTYNNLTGQSDPVAILKDSNNPQAQQLYEDYNNLQNYISLKMAAATGDEQAQAQVEDYEKAPGNSGLKNVELGQLQTAFMNTYGQQLYGANPGGQTLQGVGVNPNFGTLNNPKSTSPYYGGYPTPTPVSTTGSTVNTPSSTDILSGLTINPTTGS
jgi:hypothetical protein